MEYIITKSIFIKRKGHIMGEICPYCGNRLYLIKVKNNKTENCPYCKREI